MPANRSRSCCAVRRACSTAANRAAEPRSPAVVAAFGPPLWPAAGATSRSAASQRAAPPPASARSRLRTRTVRGTEPGGRFSSSSTSCRPGAPARSRMWRRSIVRADRPTKSEKRAPWSAARVVPSSLAAAALARTMTPSRRNISWPENACSNRSSASSRARASSRRAPRRCSCCNSSSVCCRWCSGAGRSATAPAAAIPAEAARSCASASARSSRRPASSPEGALVCGRPDRLLR